MPKGLKAKLDELVAGPTPTEFKLTVLPGYEFRSGDHSFVFVNLSLWNNSTPPAELHNIDGEYRTDQRFVLATATRPTNYIPGQKKPDNFRVLPFFTRDASQNTSIPNCTLEVSDAE
jgi:hypothetical protein